MYVPVAAIAVSRLVASELIVLAGGHRVRGWIVKARAGAAVDLGGARVDDLAQGFGALFEAKGFRGDVDGDRDLESLCLRDGGCLRSGHGEGQAGEGKDSGDSELHGD
jgi:hypothetical protein